MKKTISDLLQYAKTTWARLSGLRSGKNKSIDFGLLVRDEQVTRRHVRLPNARRATHIAVLGKSGSGKSSLLRYLSQQDIEADRGFVYFDLHGDAVPFILRTINARERRLRRHLSGKLVIVDPCDEIMSVGLNPLEQQVPDFVRIAEFAHVLRERWQLDHFGARTDELLRNALYVLSANGFTLLELAALLTHAGFRTACLKRVPNPDVRQYFELRYNQASEAMQATMREPILNKTSAFTADPHFRHIVGQPKSSFTFQEAMDKGYWVIVNLDKGRLGDQAQTLGSLMLTMLKNALFTRRERTLYTLYCDEIQNLVAYGNSLETVLSEARKFGVAIVSANQFLDQYTPEMRAAVLAVGTHAFFQLSAVDAGLVAQALDGGRSLAERLKNMPPRHCIVKSGNDRHFEIRVPTVYEPKVDYTDLLNRSRYTRGRVRAHIERDIAARQAVITRSTDDVLNDWE
jgi:ABC-type oligopeptide transport system ATPase subunit